MLVIFSKLRKKGNVMHDSGKRQDFNSGAVRDTAESKPRIDLISPYAQERVGLWVGKGAEKYEERNWEKGIPISRCVASLERHVQAYKRGDTSEDHMAAIRSNADFIMHYEECIKRGLLPASLDDMPKYEQKKSKEDILIDKIFGKPLDRPVFEIDLMDYPDAGWSARLIGKDPRFLHKDSIVRIGTGWDEYQASVNRPLKFGEAPGYYPTKEIAEAYVKAYEEKYICELG